MFKAVKQRLDVWCYSVYLSVKSQFQYKAAFFIKCIVMFITFLLEYVTTWFLISKFSGIGDWQPDDIKLTYGLATLAYALSRLFFNGFNNVSRQIKSGEFYLNMTKPFGEKFCLMSKGMPMERMGQVILGLGITIHAVTVIGTKIQPVILIVSIINGTLIYGGLFILSAAFAFWIVESREITGIMTHGTLRAIVYPISIYNRALQELFTFIIPVAFVSYYPASFMLDKPVNGAIQSVTPVIGIAVLLLSVFVWNRGVKKYEGSGG